MIEIWNMKENFFLKFEARVVFYCPYNLAKFQPYVLINFVLTQKKQCNRAKQERHLSFYADEPN